MENIPALISSLAAELFDRKLLDTAGGNISARTGETVYITPRYSGSKQHWQLRPEDILYGNLNTEELFLNPRLSREAKVHLSIYRRFPDVNGIIHAHSFHILPFASACKPIIPMLEQTEKFGKIEPVSAAPAHSQELAENVIAGLYGKEPIIQKQAAAVLLPRHGIVVAGKDLLSAADALERIDWNAYCILAGRLLE